MPSLPFVTLDVFTTQRFSGNPLAIVRVPRDSALTTEQMQQIANEFNLSETVILHEGVTGDDQIPEWRVRIFLTDAEVPFAGHPTIGTACYALGTLNALKGRLLCKAGAINVDYEDGRAKASIPHDVHIHQDAIPSSLGRELQQLQKGLTSGGVSAIDIVSPVNGMNFICVQLHSLEALALVELSEKPAPKLDAGWDTGFVAYYFYVFLRDSENQTDGQVHLRTRMIEGSLEDPATGSATCGLSAFLCLKHEWGSADFLITQGVEMGRSSNIEVKVTLKEDLKAVEQIELIGSAVKVMEGTIEFE